jgi:DnaJ-class molecular chaperone
VKNTLKNVPTSLYVSMPNTHRQIKVDGTYYEQLGVGKKSTLKEIKQAYRELAKLHHPDKNQSNGELFKIISIAYNILSDTDSRKQYDESLKVRNRKKGGAKTSWESFIKLLSGIDPIIVKIALDFIGNKKNNRDGVGYFIVFLKDNFERYSKQFPNQYIFADITNQVYHKIESHGKKTVGPNIEIILKVSMEEAYNQAVKTYYVKKYKICQACEGNGTYRTCSSCGRDALRSIVCSHCLSWEIEESDCTRCSKNSCKIRGCYIVKQQFKIPLVMDRLVFHHEADQSIEYETSGDVIFKVETKPHKLFRTYRKCDLIVNKKISLYEWLYGVDFTIQHLSGDTIRVSHNNAIQFPIYRIPQKGMPYGDGEYGDLLISLTLDYSTIDKELIYKLAPPIALNGSKINPLSNNENYEAEPYITENESEIIKFAQYDPYESINNDSITIKK